MKTCSKCKEAKPLESFPVNKKVKCGRASCCKSCGSAYIKKLYAENPDKKLAKRKQVSEWAKNNKERHKRYYPKYYARVKASPELHFKLAKSLEARARKALNNAITLGKIERMPCKICGAKGEAHHSSYDESQWLNVEWLCRIHHRAWHRLFLVDRPEASLPLSN